MTAKLPAPYLLTHAEPVHFARLRLPWPKPLISLNDSRGTTRAAVYAHAAKVRTIQETVHILGRNIHMPDGHEYLIVQFNIRPDANRRMDTDNLAAFTKPIYDALAGGSKKIPGLEIVKDDTPAFMSKREPIIWPAIKGQKSVMWVDLFALEKRPELLV